MRQIVLILPCVWSYIATFQTFIGKKKERFHAMACTSNVTSKVNGLSDNYVNIKFSSLQTCGIIVHRNYFCYFLIHFPINSPYEVRYFIWIDCKVKTLNLITDRPLYIRNIQYFWFRQSTGCDLYSTYYTCNDNDC
jgi:hypothetical protein